MRHARLRGRLGFGLGALFFSVLSAAPAGLVACGDADPGQLGAHVGGSSPANGETPTGGGGDAAADATAPQSSYVGRQLFEALLPDLEKACGGACHTAGKMDSPVFLGGTDPYVTIRGYHGIVVQEAESSILLTKGNHEGPDLIDPLRPRVLQWLRVESAFGADLPAAHVVAAFEPAAGANHVDLTVAGAPGAWLDFSATLSGSVFVLSNVRLTATSDALHATGIVFGILAPNGHQVEDDSLRGADVTVAPSASAPVGEGVIALEGWVTKTRLSVTFALLTTTPPPPVADAGKDAEKDAAMTVIPTPPAPVADGGSGGAGVDAAPDAPGEAAAAKPDGG
jgi:hypothetical protein